MGIFADLVITKGVILTDCLRFMQAEIILTKLKLAL